jgi:hypothetical protein
MKRNLLITSLLAVSLLATSGCTKTTVGTSNGPTPLTGDWKLTYYYHNSTVITDDYAGYIFDFKPNNALTATMRAQSVAGVWAISTDDATQKLNITFNTGDDKLSALTNDWHVTFVSETKVELADNDSATSDQLRFTRQ